MFREVPGYMVLFATFEYLKNFFIKHNEEKKFTTLANIFSGSAAGVLCWLAIYPQDIIKTHLSYETGKYRNFNRWVKDGGIIYCAKDIIKK